MHDIWHFIRTISYALGDPIGTLSDTNSDNISEHFRTILEHFGENEKRKRAQKIRKPCAKIRKRAQFFFLVVLDSEYVRSCSE